MKMFSSCISGGILCHPPTHLQGAVVLSTLTKTECYKAKQDQHFGLVQALQYC